MSKTRRRRAAAAKAKAKRQARERAQWNTAIAQGRIGQVPADVRAKPARRPAPAKQPATIVHRGTGQVLKPGDRLEGPLTSTGLPRCPKCGYGMPQSPRDGMFRCPNTCGTSVQQVATPTRLAPGPPTSSPPGPPTLLSLLPDRQARLRAAGMCGARTQDGGACMNTGHCPHHGGRGGGR